MSTIFSRNARNAETSCMRGVHVPSRVIWLMLQKLQKVEVDIMKIKKFRISTFSFLFVKALNTSNRWWIFSTKNPQISTFNHQQYLTSNHVPSHSLKEILPSKAAHPLGVAKAISWGEASMAFCWNFVALERQG